MLVRGLDHVQIAMPRGGEQLARDFYVAVLGLAEMRKPQGLADRGGLWLVGHGLHLHLGVEDPFTPARKAHVALLVADLAVARSTLEAAGFAVGGDDADIGVARIYGHDPFGNRIEFVSVDDEGFTTRFSE